MSKVLLLEYFSSKLYELFRDNFLPSLLAEGFLMLRLLAEDFLQAGFGVLAAADKRLGACEKTLTSIDNVEEVFKLAACCDYFYVIAPCHRGRLAKLVSMLGSLGLRSLNPPLKAIECSCDKYLTYTKLRQAGLHTPYTVKVPSREGFDYVKKLVHKEFSYPIVVKPVCGDGCLGLSLAYDDDQLIRAFRKAQLYGDYILLQEHVNGEHVSASLFVKEGKATLLSVNQQLIELKPFNEESRYLGGLTPYDVKVDVDDFVKAALAVEAEGYVGVDAIKSGDKLFIVEVNPRLTTSYIALRKVSDFSLAKAFFSNKVERPSFKARALYYKKSTDQGKASSFNEFLVVEKKPL
ncbi:MAG: hypothetical protein DRJ31_04030 [Candidatus Methanomethylicota archaeon]|uniref:ATP-grasp domain-containing protein n=1 Tax=Thermoproteota archaeon TaxID=2056631 RepID=A0A497EQM7_9CREN|nr:MAG: hypothetical protein DRJ31_04030 [Candidatus Verstraetearchaeota archaeon]